MSNLHNLLERKTTTHTVNRQTLFCECVCVCVFFVFFFFFSVGQLGYSLVDLHLRVFFSVVIVRRSTAMAKRNGARNQGREA